MNPKATSSRLVYPAIIISTLFLLIPAFYNHFPLVNPDTATYLASGFKPETPFDRPITYGLLARVFSLNGMSLWMVIFMQGFIVASLIFKIVQRVVGGRFYIAGACIVFFLSVCSGLSWVVSQVQPDVFTSVGFLCIVLLLLNKEKVSMRVLLYVLLFLSVAVHLSHPTLFAAALVCLFLLKRFFAAKETYRQVNLTIAVLIMLSLASVVIMGSAFSKSKHVFFIGSLLEKGILKKYLDDNCQTRNYKLCVYKDSLPASANDFWWNSNSPLYKVGDWKGTQEEFNEIIHKTLTTPKYLKLYLTATAKQFVVQSSTFNIGDGNFAFPKGTNVNERVAEYFPGEIQRFDRSRQNNSLQGELVSGLPNTFFFWVVLVSVAAFIFIAARWGRPGREMKLVIIVLLTGVILNSLDCAAFGIVNGRYGCKMIWVLPFFVSLYFATQISESRRMISRKPTYKW